jgi:hypothetical protein
MTVFNEGRHPGEFLLTEANGQRSRENITIASGSGIIAPGTVLGKFTSGANEGKYGPAPAAAADPDVGNQTAVAVALYGCDATSADANIAAVARDAEVNGKTLTYASTVNDDAKKAAKIAQLAAVGIIVR